MRISDWSSDVCSSDLRGQAVRAPQPRGVVGYQQSVADDDPRAGAARHPLSDRRRGDGREDFGRAALLQQGRGAAGADPVPGDGRGAAAADSEEHTSELQSLMRISYAVFCLKQKTETL